MCSWTAIRILLSPQFDDGRAARLNHLRDGQGAENLQDALVDASERLTHRTRGGVTALATTGDAGSDEQRPVNRVDHLERGDAARGARQCVAAARAVPCLHQSLSRQAL